MGGHVDKCDNPACNKVRVSYNSCRNRHCPKCQSTNTQRWVEARGRDLLPTTYFHLVFTLPHELNTFCLHYPKQLYSILFTASKETIETFSRDEKHLGAQTGMVSVLHTWGQNLSLHPHEAWGRVIAACPRSFLAAGFPLCPRANSRPSLTSLSFRTEVSEVRNLVLHFSTNRKLLTE